MPAPIAAAPVVPPSPRYHLAQPAAPMLAHSPRGNPGAWFGSDAYPPDALRQGAQGRTLASLHVDDRGRVVGCTVITSSGHASLDAATCDVAMRKGSFAPAADQDGLPIASVYTLPVRWVLPSDEVPPTSKTAALQPPQVAAGSPAPPPRHRHYDFNLLLDALLAIIAAIGEMHQNRRWRRSGLAGLERDDGVSRPVAIWRRWPSLRLVFWGSLVFALLRLA